MQNELTQQVAKYAQQRVQQEAERAAKLEQELPRYLRTHSKWIAFLTFIQDMHEGSGEFGALLWINHKLEIHGKQHWAKEVAEEFENFLEMLEDHENDAEASAAALALAQ